MRNLLKSSRTLVACLFVAALINGCKPADDDDVEVRGDCNALDAALNAARSKYTSNFNQTNCDAYKAAIKAYINGNCTSEAGKKDLENTMNAPCQL